MKIGAILVNYHTLKRVIDIALKYSSFRIIDKVVIVNNDTFEEERKTLLKLKNSKLEIIFSSENLGYSKGNNLGVKYLVNTINPDYIIISNSDVEIDEPTIHGIIEKLELYTQFGAMAPQQLDYNRNIVPLRYIELGYKRLFLLCFTTGLDRRTEKFIHKYDPFIILQSLLHGSFFICRTQAFLDCGMFDQNIFLYREEEILGVRMRKKGYKLGVVDNLYYKHAHEYSKEKFATLLRQKKLEFTSERYFFRKYLGASDLQIFFVYILEKILLCRIIIKHLLRLR